MDDAQLLEKQKQHLEWVNQEMADRAALLEKVKSGRTEWEQKPLEQISDKEWKQIAGSDFALSLVDVSNIERHEEHSVHYNGLIRMRREMQTRYPAVLPAQPVKETFSERFEEKTSAGKRKFQRSVVFTDLHTKDKNARKLEDEKNKREKKIAAMQKKFHPLPISEIDQGAREFALCKAAFSVEGNSKEAQRINGIVNGDGVDKLGVQAKQECIRQFLALDLNFDFRTDTAVANQAGRLEDLAVKIEALKIIAEYDFKAQNPNIAEWTKGSREIAAHNLGAYTQNDRQRAEFNAKFEWAQAIIEYYNQRKAVISDNCYRNYKNSELSMNLDPLSPEEQEDAKKRADYDDKKQMIESIRQADLCREKLLSQAMPKGVTLFFLQQEKKQKESAERKEALKSEARSTKERMQQKREEAKDKVSRGAKDIVDLEFSLMRLEQDKKEADALLAARKQELEDKKREDADAVRYAFNMAKLEEKSAGKAVDQAVLETSARERAVRALLQDESEILENRKEAVAEKEKNLDKLGKEEEKLNKEIEGLIKQVDDKKTGYAVLTEKKEKMERKANTHARKAHKAIQEKHSHREQIRKLKAEIKRARIEKDAKTVGEITMKNERLIRDHRKKAESAEKRRKKESKARKAEEKKLRGDKNYKAIVKQWGIANGLDTQLSVSKMILSDLQRDKQKAETDLHAAKKELKQMEKTIEENKTLSERERQKKEKKKQEELAKARSKLDKAQKKEEAARNEYKRKREAVEKSRPERNYRKEQKAFDEADRDVQEKTSALENARKSLQEANEQIKAQTTVAQMTQQEAESLIKKEREDRKEDFARENTLLQARNELMKAQEDLRTARVRLRNARETEVNPNSRLAEFMPNKNKEQKAYDEARNRVEVAEQKLNELTGEKKDAEQKLNELMRGKDIKQKSDKPTRKKDTGKGLNDLTRNG